MWVGRRSRDGDHGRPGQLTPGGCINRHRSDGNTGQSRCGRGRLATYLQAYGDLLVETNQGGLVFPSASGTPLRNRNWRRDVFDSAVEAPGLRITPHNLHDTAASLAIQDECGDVLELLGRGVPVDRASEAGDERVGAESSQCRWVPAVGWRAL